MQLYHDVIIVGAGLAGLRAAVELAGSADIAVVSKVFPAPIQALPRAALPQHWATRERTAGSGTCLTR
jgi:thioredoxin reductase